MKTPLLLALILTAHAARAELLIYNFTGSLKLIGGGTEQTIHPHGILIWDVDTGEAWQISAFKVGTSKKFGVANKSSDILMQSAGRGRNFSAVLSSQTTNSAGGFTQAVSFTYGKNAQLPLASGRTFSAPRTASMTGYGVGQASGNQFFGPAAGTYSYSRARTFALNGQSASHALLVERDKLQTVGYTETP